MNKNEAPAMFVDKSPGLRLVGEERTHYFLAVAATTTTASIFYFIFNDYY